MKRRVQFIFIEILLMASILIFLNAFAKADEDTKLMVNPERLGQRIEKLADRILRLQDGRLHERSRNRVVVVPDRARYARAA